MLPFTLLVLQEIHCYVIELLRYYGNATGCIDHVTKETLICHNNLVPLVVIGYQWICL
jgi:hypothetical protein